ncbi:AAA family ATPase [Rosistilla oblonga]|uniref:AAA family ATPase n=1 Tax=Rosistilla oblonga TaxID=2527990 RepID=UPI003A9698E4
MRFASLDLIAYGHFQNQRIDLSGGQYGLHVIYGPNEAGKSTTLRAITSLLYGFDNVTSDNFRHQNRDLRVGARIIDHDGEEIRCVRRKGRTGTLYCGDDDNAIDEAVLQKMLRGVDKAAFGDRFGITHQSLVEGGEMMVKGDGDVGQSLFAAGAGLGQLKQIQDAIEDECGKLFKKSGSKSELNRLLGELREKKRQLKESLLPVKTFVNLQQQREEKQVESENYRNAVRETRTEVKRLETLRDAIPLRAEWIQLTEQLAPLADVPMLSPDFSTRQHQASTTWAASQQKMQLVRARIEDQQKKLSALGAPDPLLDQAETIDSLVQAVGGISKAAIERPGLVKRRDMTQAQIVSKLRGIGRNDSDDVWNLQLPHDLRSKIKQLAKQYVALTQRADASAEDLESLQLQVQQVDAAIAAIEQPPSADALAAALQQAGDAATLVGDHEAAQAALARESRAVAAQLRKLTGLECDAQTATALPVPQRETIEKCAGEWESISSRQQQLVEKQAACTDKLEQLTTRLHELHGAGEVPSEQELIAAREQRDQLSASLASTESAEDIRCDREAFESLLAMIEQCDQMSDRLRREAERVSRRATLEAERGSIERAQQRLAEESEQLQTQRQQFADRWNAIWADCGLQPKSPREMLGWLGEHQRLVELYEAQVEAEQAVARHALRIERVTQQLLAAMPNGSASPASDDLVALVRQAGAAVATTRKQQQEYEERTKQKQQLQQSLPQSQRRNEQIQEELAQWQAQWREVTSRLELDEQAGTDEVDGVVEAYHELVVDQKEFDSFQRRIDGIDTDARAFDAQVRGLGLPIKDASLDASKIVEGWAKDLKQAQKTQTQREQIEQQIAQDQRDLTALEQERIDCQTQLDLLCKEACCDAPEQLAEVYRNSQQKQQLEHRRQEHYSRLTQMAGTLPVDEFLEKVADVDPETLDQDIDELHHKLLGLEEDHTASCQELGQLDQQRKAMDGGANAADLQQEIHELLSRIDRHAAQYARLRVAETLLNRAVTNYRDRNQAPILKIASDYFRRLTLDSYSELRADNNDKGDPVLLGVRAATGQSVDLRGMSQGTADQLYLALRLASLKHSFASSDPIPLVVDDILIQCDLQRSRAAFELLAELSNDTQVIFFTHNEALLETARECVDANQLFVQTLTRDSVEPTAEVKSPTKAEPKRKSATKAKSKAKPKPESKPKPEPVDEPDDVEDDLFQLKS